MDLHNLAFAQKRRMCVHEVAPEFSAGRGCNKVGLKASASEVGLKNKSQMLCSAELCKNFASVSHAHYLQIGHFLT